MNDKSPIRYAWANTHGYKETVNEKCSAIWLPISDYCRRFYESTLNENSSGSCFHDVKILTTMLRIIIDWKMVLKIWGKGPRTNYMKNWILVKWVGFHISYMVNKKYYTHDSDRSNNSFWVKIILELWCIESIKLVFTDHLWYTVA